MSSSLHVEQADIVATAEQFAAVQGRIERYVTLRSGDVAKSHEAVGDLGGAHDLAGAFNDAWLRRSSRIESARNPLTVADLFSGCGGLSLGAHEAARAIGRHAEHVLAVDNNVHALGVFGDNFPEATLHSDGIEELVDGEVGGRLTARERRLRSSLGGLDLAIGGPPCQGNSDLNNHTRRADPRNQLYLRMARFVEVVRPTNVVIENVPGVAHDRNGVVAAAAAALVAAGYRVDTGLLTATDFGAAQQRRRHVLLGTLAPGVTPSVERIVDDFGQSGRNVVDAIYDLGIEQNRGAFGTAATHRAVNEARIEYLFANGLYDLPNEQRPDCHRLKPHSYTSVYGRMHPDRPAPTITSGFGSTGQGRFVHPFERRTLTPHEAARVQGFPDWFRFGPTVGRRALQEMIGNAVPSRLAYAAIASVLR